MNEDLGEYILHCDLIVRTRVDPDDIPERHLRELRQTIIDRFEEFDEAVLVQVVGVRSNGEDIVDLARQAYLTGRFDFVDDKHYPPRRRGCNGL